MSETADLVFVNGHVVTVDADNSIAQALAVHGNVIMAVGDNAAINALVGPSTRIVDLAGATLLPGINDSHIHAVSLGYSSPPISLNVSFPTVKSIADVVEAVREAASMREPGEWILGGGWDPGYLSECVSEAGRYPNRLDLDAAAPNNPVFLNDFSLHSGWVNTATLLLAGIDLQGDFTDDDNVVSDADGRPTGVVYERVAFAMRGLIPAVSQEAIRRSVGLVERQLSALGVTSITDPAIGVGDARGAMGIGALDAYRELVHSDEAVVRVKVLRYPAAMSSTFEEFRAGLEVMADVETPDPRMFEVVGTKVFADGIPPNRTAWMFDEYVGGGGTGALAMPGDTDEERVAELKRIIRYAHDQGHQVGVHATGDRTAVVVVEALVDAVLESPRPDPRHYVIHADFLSEESMKLCVKHGIGANFNPAIKWTIADLQLDFVSPELEAYEWPYRSAIDAGIRVCSSSDAPVTFPDWRQGLSTMVLRESKASGRVSGPEQCITLMEAIRTYTINAAWQDRAEDWKGSLEVGKVADLCVLRENLFDLDAHDIPNLSVLMTVLDGRVVFESDGSTPDHVNPVAGDVASHYGPRTPIAALAFHGHTTCCAYDSLVVPG